MKNGWVGNTELQKRVQRRAPDARVIVEAVVEDSDAVKVTRDDWSNADSLTGVDLLDRGGVVLSSTLNTHVSLAQTSTASVGPDPTRIFAWRALDITWDGTLKASRTVSRLTAHLDPDVDGTGREVDEFKARLYRVTDEGTGGGGGGEQPTVDDLEVGDLGIEIAPITPIATANVSSNAAGDFVFDFASDERIPRVGPSPTNGDAPRTIVVLWGVKSDGTAALNTSWLGDDTSNGTETTGLGGTTKHVSLARIDEERSEQAGGRFTVSNNSGMPRFTLEGAEFTSSATVSFTANANDVDLGSAPGSDTDLEVVAAGERPFDTALTWELSDDDGTSWTQVADGDIIGEDNTDSGGNDLSGLSRQQTYDARVTLDPATDTFASPVARQFGVRELTVTSLDGITKIGRLRWSLDPVDLTGEISEMPLAINRNGRLDFRDEATDLFASNHIGEMEFRVLIGHPDLDRQDWLHLDTFLVEDYDASGGAAIEVTCVSPLSVLKDIVPPLVDSGNRKLREPLEYDSQSLKAVYDDLIDNQVGLAARHRGQGVEDSTTTVTKRIEDSTAKDEVDAISYLAGGAAITSQGRVKFTRVFDDSPPLVEIPLEEASIRTLTPGYRSRIDEFKVPFGWDNEAEEYVGEVFSVDGDALTKLGRARIDPPDNLDDTIARWIPDDSVDPASSTLASSIAKRTTLEFGVGLPIVEVDAQMPHPELEPGDPIAIQTDQLVFRDPKTDQDWRGVMWLVGTVTEVVGPWGDRLAVWVRQFLDTAPSQTDGNREKFKRPEVQSATLAVNDDGTVDMEVNLNAEAESIRLATSTSSFPSKTTTQSGTLVDITDGVGEVTGVATIDPSQTLYVSLLAYEQSDGGGAESTRIHRTKTVSSGLFNVVSEDTQESDFDSDGTVEGRLTIEVIADSGSYDVDFQDRQGRGTTWSAVTSSNGLSNGQTASHDVDLVEGKLSFIRYEVLEAGTTNSLGRRVVAFDPDEIAEVRSVNASIDPDTGTLKAEAAGDDDTATIYLTHTKDGTEPNDPTSSNADQTINARSGSVTFSGSVGKGSEARVKARGENGSGSLAPASTIKSARATRRTPESTVNLLGEDAGPERTFTTEYAYFDKFPISALGLSVGDTVSARAQMHGDGTSTSAGQLLIRFFDSSGSQVGSTAGLGSDTTEGSTSFEDTVVENVSIPSNTDSISVLADNDQNDGSTITTRRAMLNVGPVAAPYSDPPSREAENLLGWDALPEHSDTSSIIWDYLESGDGPSQGSASASGTLTELGLQVGDVLSFGAYCKSDTGADRVQIGLNFLDSGGSTVEQVNAPDITSSSYERSVHHGAVIPDTTTAIRVFVRNRDTTETAFVERAMLNTGARLARVRGSFFGFDRDDFGGVDSGTIDAIGFTGTNMPREAGESINMNDVAFAGGQVKVEHAGEEYELYTYDPDLSTLGGVAVGARKQGTGNGSNAGDFTLRVGPEDITVTGGENTGLSGDTLTYVGWDRTNSNLITDQTDRKNALGKDIIFLGEITSQTDTDSGSGEGSENTGDGTLK